MNTYWVENIVVHLLCLCSIYWRLRRDLVRTRYTPDEFFCRVAKFDIIRHAPCRAHFLVNVTRPLCSTTRAKTSYKLHFTSLIFKTPHHIFIVIVCNYSCHISGPMKETLSDFWKMVWENHCKIIIMLCDLWREGMVGYAWVITWYLLELKHIMTTIETGEKHFLLSIKTLHVHCVCTTGTF